MSAMEPPETRTPPTQVTDRADLPRGFLNTVWPLAAVALILLMLLRACVPAATASPPPTGDQRDMRPVDGDSRQAGTRHSHTELSAVR
jgi:hypothetical protein